MADKKISTNTAKPHGSISSYYITIGIMVVLLTVNFFLWQLARNRIYNTSQAAFEGKTRDITEKASSMIDEYGEIATHGKALFEINPNLSRRQFETFFKSVLDNKGSGYKAISAVLYADNVTKPDEFIAKVRADKTHSNVGNPFFSIVPEVTSPAVVVNYIQPLEDNQDLFGYNISSDNQQAQVFTAAHLSRTIRVSDIMTFLNKKRVAVYQPITTDEPTHTLLGFVVLLVDPDLFFQQLAELADDNISIKVYKGNLSEKDLMKPDNVIYYDDEIPAIVADHASKDAYTSVGHIEAGGVPMTLAFSSSRDLQLSWAQKMVLNMLLYGGSITIFIMFGVMSYILFTRSEEEKLAQ